MWDILFVMSSVTGNLCNKCPKWLVEQNSSYSDYFNAISGFTSNRRAPGSPVTLSSKYCLECYPAGTPGNSDVHWCFTMVVFEKLCFKTYHINDLRNNV